MSIGFAVRNDVKYPEDMYAYGTRDRAQIQLHSQQVRYYEGVHDQLRTHRESLRAQHDLVHPQVSHIPIASGFTNPLHSPGITAAMSTSMYASELTHRVPSTKSQRSSPSARPLLPTTTLPGI